MAIVQPSVLVWCIESDRSHAAETLSGIVRLLNPSGIQDCHWGDALSDSTPWFLVGNGGMDPYDSPLRSPIVVPKPPFLHSLLRTSQSVWSLKQSTSNSETLGCV